MGIKASTTDKGPTGRDGRTVPTETWILHRRLALESRNMGALGRCPAAQELLGFAVFTFELLRTSTSYYLSFSRICCNKGYVVP